MNAFVDEHLNILCATLRPGTRGSNCVKLIVNSFLDFSRNSLVRVNPYNGAYSEATKLRDRANSRCFQGNPSLRVRVYKICISITSVLYVVILCCGGYLKVKDVAVY